MKKVVFCIFAMFSCMGIFAQQQPVVAVAPFDVISGMSEADANVITRVFNIRLGNTNSVVLVDRSIIDRVLGEHKFQAGDWSDVQKTAELGRALNANWIVRGELEKFGSSIIVTVQFYDIKTFQYKGGGDARLANAEEAYDKMDPLVNKLVETIKNSNISTSYKIGDIGPAEGIVFYDKGNNAGGWRYLEAAPVTTEVRSHWVGYYLVYDEEAGKEVIYGGDYGRQVDGTGTAIGNGRRNTQLILEFLSIYGEGGYAAGYCDNLKHGGVEDWFLPSKEELNSLYMNLTSKGIGDFASEEYWSSSAEYDGDGCAWLQDFKDGKQRIGPLGEASPYIRVRAIRAF